VRFSGARSVVDFIDEKNHKKVIHSQRIFGHLGPVTRQFGGFQVVQINM
jgi:hypothetical protein